VVQKPAGGGETRQVKEAMVLVLNKMRRLLLNKTATTRTSETKNNKKIIENRLTGFGCLVEKKSAPKLAI
jgi:hypothetical protein